MDKHDDVTFFFKQKAKAKTTKKIFPLRQTLLLLFAKYFVLIHIRLQ